MHFSPIFASLLLALTGTPVFGQTTTTDTASQSTTQSSDSTSQSSGSQSATSSTSQTATSSAGGGGGSGGAQPPSQLIQGLQSAGFSGMASALNQVSGSPGGNELYSKLQNDGGNSPYLVFAPTDQAVQNLPSSVTSNSSLLAEHLSYHFVRGQFDSSAHSNSTSGGGAGDGSSTSSSNGGQFSTTPGSDAARPTGLFGRIFAPRRDGSGNNNSSGGGGSGVHPLAGVWPNVTIGRTLLNASQLVQLEGNKSQVLVWDRSSSDGNITILNQASNSQNITVQNSTQQDQFLIAGINGTLIPPGNLTTALTAVNATVAQNLLQTVPVPGPNGNISVLEALQAARGVTIFVPNNAAFDSQFNSSLPGLQNNATALTALLQNHFINGTTVYSTQIGNDSQAVSAAGENFDFIRNSTGIFVQSSNGTTAEVVRPDVLLNNGVVHVIDRVFFDTSSNPSAAQSAFSAASSVAAQSTTASGPITAIIGGGGSSGTSTDTSSESQQTSTDTSSQTQTTNGGGGSETMTATTTVSS
ncbi:hypothetical protein D9619_012360 [Psilocybe cf. subviscida]|uniref:FAS1 domain-containing protein n=1 Tax=Psilocybe cf. subviscida TaxID=2480587 RepID=A0A8H5ERC8_9AGAR|nr:hypothetical protein D9619_012360 [Psilocybe cf. subviscida]